MTLLPDLQRIFGSRTKTLEILFLLEGAKEVVRQGFYEHELPLVEQFCKEKKLFLVKSPFKVVLDDQQYSNSGALVRIDNPQGMYWVYVSKDEKTVLLASYYETTNNHQELGRLLGYPECCIRFFCEHFSSQNKNPEIPSTNPFTNLSQRDQDLVLISHFPCAADCKGSITIGQKNLEMIRRYDQQLAEHYIQSLSKRGDYP